MLTSASGHIQISMTNAAVVFIGIPVIGLVSPSTAIVLAGPIEIVVVTRVACSEIANVIGGWLPSQISICLLTTDFYDFS